jgi:aspartyl-tRNA(Asn)/glutamyl-tRNA(Gln) amidotransferase subunit A
MLENYISPYDATAVRLLKEAGAVILGRTNMDEFALGGSGENSAYGKTLNPINHTRVPGGTSSGSAAAVAADMCLIAIGTDTGGSVRQPGSFCGVYGFKPSYGGVSRSGLIAAASSLDSVGVLARDINDVNTIYSVIGKEDVLDGTSIPETVRQSKLKTPYSKKVAYPKSYIESEGVDGEVKQNFYESVKKLESLGYSVEAVEIDALKYALSAYYIVNTAEVSTNLSRFDGLRFGGGLVTGYSGYEDFYKKTRGTYFGKEAKRRIILGSYVLSHGYYDAYYGKATILRNILRAEFEKVFKQYSIILSPTAPTTAFTFNAAKTPLEMYLEDIFTVPANLIGIPGISMPSGKDSTGLPFGLQALADFGCEHHLFALAQDFGSQNA